MKKTVWIFTALSVFAFLITLIQSGSELEWWSFSSNFIKDLERFTFFLNFIFLIVTFILSFKLLVSEKKFIYFISLILPILSVAFCVYLFLVRTLDLIFFD